MVGRANAGERIQTGGERYPGDGQRGKGNYRDKDQRPSPLCPPDQSPARRSRAGRATRVRVSHHRSWPSETSSFRSSLGCIHEPFPRARQSLANGIGSQTGNFGQFDCAEAVQIAQQYERTVLGSEYLEELARGDYLCRDHRSRGNGTGISRGRVESDGACVTLAVPGCERRRRAKPPGSGPRQADYLSEELRRRPPGVDPRRVNDLAPSARGSGRAFARSARTGPRPCQLPRPRPPQPGALVFGREAQETVVRLRNPASYKRSCHSADECDIGVRARRAERRAARVESPLPRRCCRALRALRSPRLCPCSLVSFF